MVITKLTNTTPRRILWISLGLGLVIASAAVLAGRRLGWRLTPDVRVGSGRAYAILGDIPVKHRDRIKPLHSLAITQIQRIYGRPAIKLAGPDGKSTTTWEPVAAILDWSVRPEFWDNQDFILVEDRVLRHLLVEASIRAELHSIAEHVAPESGKFLNSLGSQPKLTEADLRAAAERAGEASSARKSLNRLAARMGARHSWLSPGILEKTRFPYEGRELTLAEWVGEIQDTKERGGSVGKIDPPGLKPIEEAAVQAGERFLIYRSIRDHNFTDTKPQDVMMLPRPSDETYLNYSTEAFHKGLRPDQNLSPIETDVANTLVEYLETLPSRKWALPREDGVFDQEYEVWLSRSSRWIPVGSILRSDHASLSKAGMPSNLIADFRKNYQALEVAQRATPGEIPEALAIALVGSARDIGVLNLQNYPYAATMARESRYNRLDPFTKAAIAYGSSLVLLLLSFGITADRRTMLGTLGIAFYVLGLVGLTTGIAIGMYGSFLRFRIFPTIAVVSMYETVIFVALAMSAIGLAAEIVWRKKYAALVATGIALVATLLAQNSRVLDPNVQVAVLEWINRWLVSHAVPMLSGYAAFALAMGLGLLALGYVLTATYRRAASYRELAWPLLPGVPLYLLGRFLMDPVVLDRPWFGHIRLGLTAIGAVLSILGGLSALGEFANRSPRLAIVMGLLVAALGATGLIAGSSGTLPLWLAAALTVPDAWLVPSTGVVLMMMGRLAGPSGEALEQIRLIARFNFWIILFGLLMVGAGTVMGGAWARSIWGQSWTNEPKVLWTLITFGVYLVPLLGRMKPFGVVAASAVCFAVLLISWCGVNSLISAGRHDFVWSRGEGWSFVISATVILPSVVGAAVWRRSRSEFDAAPEV